jgi:coupling of ubiquitin conjugation to ER degradation protein 1
LYSANIHYDLLRTGSVELTTNKILERGLLDAVRVPSSYHVLSFSLISLQPPEAYFTLYPRPSSANVAPLAAGMPAAARTSTAATTQIQPKETLISRFGLETRVSAADVAPSPEQDAGGRAMWEDTAEKREASLRERKARMILAARQYVWWPFRYVSLQADGRLPWKGECWMHNGYQQSPLLHNYLGSFLLTFLFLTYRPRL